MYLRGPVASVFYYLYLIHGIYSCRIAGWEVHEKERADHTASMLTTTLWKEDLRPGPRVLHADSGIPMKGASLRVTLQKLGIEPSWSRPRVSDDSPCSEALFLACKYRLAFPKRGFATLTEAARQWVHGFAAWYNEEHRHSGSVS